MVEEVHYGGKDKKGRGDTSRSGGEEGSK